jgi:hypothetical protein
VKTNVLIGRLFVTHRPFLLKVVQAFLFLVAGDEGDGVESFELYHDEMEYE